MALSSERLALLRAALAEKGLAAPRASEIPRRAERARAPLSLAQERLFFLDLYEPGTARYNDALAVRVQGALDAARLERALALVAARHEILRTTFALAGSGPEQRVGDAAPALRVLDLSDRRDPGLAARELAAAEAREPFDLERAPPWRAALARLGAESWLLVVTMHHVVSDGATMGLLMDELSAAYASGASGGAPALQFGDYSAFERACADEGRAARDLAHWRRVLGGALPAFAWPDGLGGASGRGAQIPVAVGAPSVARLGELARAHGATANHVLLAAWLALLALESGEHDQRTGIASSLRERPELRSMLGFFVQSLVLRADLSGDPTFAEVVARVRSAALDAHAHAAVPFDRVARELERGSSAGAGGASLAPTFFSHMRDAIRAPSFPGARCAWEFVDPGTARFELALVLHESDAGIAGFLEHDLGVFSPESAARLAGDWLRVLEAALARPAARLSELRAACAPRGRVLRRGPVALPGRLRRAAGG